MMGAFRPAGEATRTWAWAGAMAPTSIATAVTQAIPDAETASLSGLLLAVYIPRQACALSPGDSNDVALIALPLVRRVGGRPHCRLWPFERYAPDQPA